MPPGSESVRALRAALAERMPDFDLDRLESLRQALPLGRMHAALSCLVGLRAEDLVLRAAALHSLHAMGRARFSIDERDSALYWLDEQDRTTVWRNLQDGGFVRHSDKGWTITQEGGEIYSLLQLLFELGSKPALTFSAIINDAIEGLNGNPANSLQNLTNQMRQLEADLTDALLSRSSVRMAEQLARCAKAIAVAQRVRAQAERHGNNADLLAHVQDLHGCLSALYVAFQRVSKMQAELVQDFIHLPSGTTLHDVTAALMATELDDLAAVGHHSRRPSAHPKLAVREDLVGSAAERFLTREAPVAPIEPGPSRGAEHGEAPAIELAPALQTLAADLDALPGSDADLVEFLNHGTPEETMLRLFALDYLGQEGLPSPAHKKLADQPWRVHVEGGVVRPKSGPIRIMSKSRLRKVKQ